MISSFSIAVTDLPVEDSQSSASDQGEAEPDCHMCSVLSQFLVVADLPEDYACVNDSDQGDINFLVE